MCSVDIIVKGLCGKLICLTYVFGFGFQVIVCGGCFTAVRFDGPLRLFALVCALETPEIVLHNTVLRGRWALACELSVCAML